MIYRPPEREQRPRGRMNPTREIAVVLVLVALVLAGLLPVAFPNVPLPHLPGSTAVAIAPPTPISMPQPYPQTPPAGTVPGVAPGALGPSTPTLDPFGPLTTSPSPTFFPAPTEALPTYVLPSPYPTLTPELRPGRTPSPTASGGYPGQASATTIGATASATSATPTATGATPTPTATGTPPTATPTATAGSATATASPSATP